jgi:hypothetical protein
LALASLLIGYRFNLGYFYWSIHPATAGFTDVSSVALCSSSVSMFLLPVKNFTNNFTAVLGEEGEESIDLTSVL